MFFRKAMSFLTTPVLGLEHIPLSPPQPKAENDGEIFIGKCPNDHLNPLSYYTGKYMVLVPIFKGRK
jgi:hypothetical protein